MFKKQHFGIRKFTVGAASIAVGATLFFSANASADAAEVDGQAWTNDNLGESYGTAYVESNGNAEGQAYEPALAESNAEGSTWVADNAVSSNVDGQAWTNDNLGESYGSAYVDANGNVDGQAWEPTLAEGPETGSAWVENNVNETVTATGEPAYAEPLPEGHIGINGEPAYAEAPPKGSLDGYLYDHGTGVTHHVPKGSLDGYYYDHGTSVTHELPEGDIAINGTGVTHELPEGDISLNGTGVTHELPEGTLDTDNDGYTDAEEVAAGTNLYDAASTSVETAVGKEAIATDAHVANEASAQASVEATPAQAEGQALPETGSTKQGTLFGGLVAFIGAVLAFFGLRRKA